MARAGHDYATAETQKKTKPGAESPGSRPGRAKAAGAKATTRLKKAGRKTAAKLKVAPEPEAKAAEEAATEVAASVEPALEEEQDEFTAVVQGAQQGDSECFRILYREVQPKLLRYLSFMVDNDAEDIASETWLQATRDFHKFSGTFDNFRGWITTIARHRAMDHLRKTSRQAPVVDVPVEEFSYFASADDTEARAMESIATDDAVKMISSLPKDQAEAVMLRAVVGMDAKTAAAIVGKRAGAVRTAAYRGLKTLAKRLGVEG
ncbi:MAG: sigma-70 family RNA polymerase sigma factor [Streptosporangiales bacterium]|nr:sigma-70 family RNA polymerase sigma factor [Streptosporangiales bacterium]